MICYRRRHEFPGVPGRDCSCILNVGVSRVGHIQCLSHREVVPNCRICMGHIEGVEGGEGLGVVRGAGVLGMGKAVSYVRWTQRIRLYGTTPDSLVRVYVDFNRGKVEICGLGVEA